MSRLIKILEDSRYDRDEKINKVCDVFRESSNFIEVESLLYNFYNNLYKLKKEYQDSPYKENYIIDENKSVKWNKEETERLKNEFIKNKKESLEDMNSWKGIVNSALIKYISSYFGISQHNSKVLYDYFKSTQDRISEVLHSIRDFIEVLNKLDLGEE